MNSVESIWEILFQSRMDPEFALSLEASLPEAELTILKKIEVNLKSWVGQSHQLIRMKKQDLQSYHQWIKKKEELFVLAYPEIIQSERNMAKTIENLELELRKAKNHLNQLIEPFNKKEQEKIKQYEWPTFSKALWLGLKSSIKFKQECLDAVKSYELLKSKKEKLLEEQSLLLKNKNDVWEGFKDEQLAPLGQVYVANGEIINTLVREIGAINESIEKDLLTLLKSEALKKQAASRPGLQKSLTTKDHYWNFNWKPKWMNGAEPLMSLLSTTIDIPALRPSVGSTKINISKKL